MSQTDIENAILRKLYAVYFRTTEDVSLFQLSEEEKWDNGQFLKAIDHLKCYGFIESVTLSGHSITTAGIVHAQEQGIAPNELVTQNLHAQEVILEYLAQAYDESGPSRRVGFDDLLTKSNLSSDVFHRNLQALFDFGLAEPVGRMMARVTSYGLEVISDIRKRKGIGEAFEHIEQLNPQQRGRELQRLFARVVEQHGWLQEESVKTSHEEMDVIVYRGREYFLVECKWEKQPIEAGVIRELHGKLSNRVDVRGIVVSMSGFTKGAVEQVESYSASRIVLLFGPEDVRAMVDGSITFDELLDGKYKELVTRRKARFS